MPLCFILGVGEALLCDQLLKLSAKARIFLTCDRVSKRTFPYKGYITPITMKQNMTVTLEYKISISSIFPCAAMYS